MIYDPRPDLLYLKERIDKLEKVITNMLDALYIIIGDKNEGSEHNSL